MTNGCHDTRSVVNPCVARICPAYARRMTNESSPRNHDTHSNAEAPTNTSDDAGFGADDGVGDGTGLGEGNGNAGQSSEDTPSE